MMTRQSRDAYREFGRLQQRPYPVWSGGRMCCRLYGLFGQGGQRNNRGWCNAIEAHGRYQGSRMRCASLVKMEALE